MKPVIAPSTKRRSRRQIAEAVARAQALVKKYSSGKMNVVNELIAERRREAQREIDEMLKMDIKKGSTDIKFGRVKKFDAKRIIVRGRKKLKRSSS